MYYQGSICGSFSDGGSLMVRLFWSWTTFMLLTLIAVLSCETDTIIDPKDTDTLELDTLSKLLVAPLIFAPTKNSFGLNAVVADGDPKNLKLFILKPDNKVWTEIDSVQYPAPDIVEWQISNVSPGTAYPYVIVTSSDVLKKLDSADSTKPPGLLFSGKAKTQCEPGESFSFALITDTHLRPHAVTPGLDLFAVEETTLLSVVNDVEANQPDFIIHLGDVLDFHDYGFNDPPPSGDITRNGYLNYRRLLADMIGNTAHYMVIGNWDGENGDYGEEVINRSREQRLLYVPNPTPETYPQGGSPHEDYYAFTWGDALFIVLNVMTYTPNPHLLSGSPGLVDDWTLGEEQMVWFEKTLAEATAKWRFVFIHHTVGGAAADFDNSAYGRGGGQAANVGEQARVHAGLVQHGVQIFFYGHDHVFTDMVVDSIHYTLPGSAGATWKFGTDQTGYTKFWPESGHSMVTVTPQNVLVEFVAEGGEVVNSYTLGE